MTSLRRPYQFAIATFSLVALSSGLLSGCSTGDSSAPNSTPVDSFLVAGNSAQYNGTESVQVTFTNPGGSAQNSTATYTTSEQDTVQAAPPGAPAPIQLHKFIRYTTVQAPQYGTQLSTNSIDQFENLVPANAEATSYNVVLVQAISQQTGTSVTAANAAPIGAPYAYVGTSTTNYATPTTILTLPLVAGASWSASLARTVTNVSSTTDASNTVYNSTNLTTQFQSDGSYNETGQLGLNVTTTRSVLSDGSGTLTNTNSTTSNVNLIETVGAPVPLSGGGDVIPVTSTNSMSTTPTSYSAIDWYPGAGALSGPLASQTSTVVGPTSSLPSACTYTGTQPNIIEYDTTSTSVDPIAGTSTVSSSQTYNSNGLMVCTLSTTTLMQYSLTTGTLSKTQVTTSAVSLSN